MSVQDHRTQIEKQISRAWQQVAEAEADGDIDGVLAATDRMNALLDSLPRQRQP